MLLFSQRLNIAELFLADAVWIPACLIFPREVPSKDIKDTRGWEEGNKQSGNVKNVINQNSDMTVVGHSTALFSSPHMQNGEVNMK